MQFSVDYRPVTLDDMYPTFDISAAKKMLESPEMPRVLIFPGPSGCGKTTFARIIGATFLAANDEERKDIMFNGRNAKVADYHEYDLTRDKSAEDFNRMVAELNTYIGSSFFERKGFFLFDELDLALHDNQTRIIKALGGDDGSIKNICVVITTNNMDKLAPKVRSRGSAPLVFSEIDRKFGTKLIIEIATRAKKAIDSTTATMIYDSSTPSKTPRDILNTFQSYCSTGIIPGNEKTSGVIANLIQCILDMSTAIKTPQDDKKSNTEALDTAAANLYRACKSVADTKGGYDSVIMAVSRYYQGLLEGKHLKYNVLRGCAMTLEALSSRRPVTFGYLLTDLIRVFYYVAEERSRLPD